MKSYTDIEQSKKLAEILPLESADMCYKIGEDLDGYITKTIYTPLMHTPYNDDYIPCWSLAALLDVLPNNENISTNLSKGGYIIATQEYTNSWFVDYEDETDGLNNCVTSADNPVDACVEMVIKLKERNLI